MVTAVILCHPPAADATPLTGLLREAQTRIAERHARLFRQAGADVIQLADAAPFAARVRSAAANIRGGLVLLGAGAVPLLSPADATRLVALAAGGGRRALTNNRYSADVTAVGDPRPLRDLPDLPTDNALPRWLEEVAGFEVAELPGRDRLALDVDTPLDIALLALSRAAPRELRQIAGRHGLEVPRLAEIRALAVDPRGELLVFGRASSRTLAWLERNVRCRVRFLAEERGLRASSPLAQAAASLTRPPRATLGRLLEDRGPDAFAQTVAELADGALVDSRVLLADRCGADESTWPPAEDRFASDLLRPERISDPWLAALTASAAVSNLPIVLGGHTLVGPGLPIVVRGARTTHSQRAGRGP